MKTIYVASPMPMDNEVMADIKSSVLAELGISINVSPFNDPDDNQTCMFDCNDNDEITLVNFIHELDEFQCFYALPLFNENGDWVNYYQ